jgi:hypothetical protein
MSTSRNSQYCSLLYPKAREGRDPSVDNTGGSSLWDDESWSTLRSLVSSAARPHHYRRQLANVSCMRYYRGGYDLVFAVQRREFDGSKCSNTPSRFRFRGGNPPSNLSLAHQLPVCQWYMSATDG